jgi:uncharacterized protein (DUF4415 family)
MAKKWPSFVTKDLTDKDGAEMLRRWKVYDREMRTLIATGKFHQDDDGWWVETSTGQLVGPDPEIERPLTARDARKAKSLKDVLPQLHESIKRARGRPRVESPKAAVTLRVHPDTLKRFKAAGKDWRAKMAETLDTAKPQAVKSSRQKASARQ